jgi:LETM1-like protein
VALDLEDPAWLATLVDEELEKYDPAAARARLPSELTLAPAQPGQDLAPGARLLVARSLRRRTLDAPPGRQVAFLDTVRGHVALVLDVALLAGEPFDRPRRRAALAAALAAAVGEPVLALDADPAAARQDAFGQPDNARAVDRALRAAARALHARFFPPGDPRAGLPLWSGTLAILRRHLARVAMGAHRLGRLDAETLARHRAFAQREAVLLVEGVAGLLAAALPGEPSDAARAVRRRQLGRLGLPPPETREARRALAAPRDPAALAIAAPARIRPFLYEQLLLAQLRADLPAAPAAAFVEAFLAGAGLDAQTMVGAQVEARAQHDDHLAWYEAMGGAHDWEALAEAWGDTTDEVVERVTAAVSQNIEAVVTEVRQTGELGQLLAKAAGGGKLSGEEKRKVKAQLLDLAKAIPALAIFAAPGGMLLLPLLAKLLPFNVLPSAWDRMGTPEKPKG